MRRPHGHTSDLVDGRAPRGRRPSARPAAGRRAARSSCRAGCSSSCSRSACWRSGRSPAPPGTVLLLFIVAAVIALILNPLVAVAAARARSRAGWRSSLVYLGFFLGARRAPASCSPTRSPTRRDASSDDVPRIIDSANEEPRRPAGLLRRQGHQHRGQGAGRDRAADAAGATSSAARATSSRSATRPADAVVTAGFGADPRLRPVGLHADLRRADRRARAARDAAGRRHAGGRLPDARAARRRRLRPRPAALQPRDGHGRRRRAVHLRRRSASSRTARRTRWPSGSSSGSWSSSRSSGRSSARCRRCSWRSSRTR